jgi:hypothetical protein
MYILATLCSSVLFYSLPSLYYVISAYQGSVASTTFERACPVNLVNGGVGPGVRALLLSLSLCSLSIFFIPIQINPYFSCKKL